MEIAWPVSNMRLQEDSMFIGHFEVALAAKKAASRTSLGTLILAAQFIDLLWPIFLLLGLEHVRIAPGITKVSPFDFYDYPISHSLLMVVLWSVVLGGLYYAFRSPRRLDHLSRRAQPPGCWTLSCTGSICHCGQVVRGSVLGSGTPGRARLARSF